MYLLGRLTSAMLEVRITETGTMVLQLKTPKFKWIYAMGALS